MAFVSNQISRIGIFDIVTLAPLLGGATERWSQSILLTLIALLVSINPPKRLDRSLVVAGCGLLSLAGASFLPARWLALPAWRTAAIDAGILLPSTMTPQPWVTLDALLLMLGGFLWLAWLAQQNWSAGDRRVLARLFCFGALLLAIVALVSFYRGLQIPFWLRTERCFGPFQNRNQTANFFALSAILCLSLAHDDLRRRSRWTFAWAFGGAILVWALFLSYSRAGIGIFFLGLLVWVGTLSRGRRRLRESAPGERQGAENERFRGLRPRNSLKKAALGLAFILALLTGFLLFGGETLNRFIATNAVDFRLLVWKDAFSMIGSSPWLGSGLGNFDSLFPFFRNASIQQQRIIHPESDWLWLAAELGLPAVLLVIGAIVALLRQVLPLEPNTARSLRAACAACAIAFVAHGFLDVSAHRLGTALPALFILALSLNSPRPEKPDSAETHAPQSRLCPWIFRLLALLVIVFSVGRMRQPDEKAAARRSLQSRDFEASISQATHALGEAPLEWESYYTRGAARAATGQWLEALGDFRRANLLEPHFVRLPIAEGNLWLSVRPPLALQSWREALRRCGSGERGRLFSEILGRSAGAPDLLRRMESLARDDIDLEIAFLPYAGPQEIDQRLAQLLPRAESLSPDQRKNLLLIASRRCSELKDFESAYRLARRAVARPPLPAFKEAPDALLEFTKDPGNFAAGFALYSAQLNAGQIPDALLTLEKANRQANAPKYFRFLTAELQAQLGQWEKAWAELRLFAQF